MTGSVSTARPAISELHLPASRASMLPFVLLAALALAQFSLIFAKSFNWDEFLHFGMVYQLREGTLARPLQTLLARLLYWAPETSDDLFAQMVAARVFVWAAFLGGLAAIYRLARCFVSREDSGWTALAYLASGNAFAHGFAIRTDPIAMAMLMLALYLLASRRPSWPAALMIGGLTGVAGLLTIKSVLFAPCFAGLAWMKLAQSEDRPQAIVRLAAIGPVAAAAFAAALALHRSGLAPLAPVQRDATSLAHNMQWLTQGLVPQPGHALVALVTAPVLVLAMVKARAALREGGFDRDRIVALAGLCLPLAAILFYRNVFPYFFVFLFAPVAVGLAPAIARLRRRWGRLALAALICLVPLVKLVNEPRDVIVRQRALIDYVHREVAPDASYLDYAGMVPDYARPVDHLLSGLGLAGYRARGAPLVARAVEQGRLAAVIENRPVISQALAGEVADDGLLAADVSALQGNFVPVGSYLWLAGEAIPAGAGPVAIDVPADGEYTPQSALVIDGTAYRSGAVVRLRAGRHTVSGARPKATVLWRGNRIPTSPPNLAPGDLFSAF